MKTKGIHFAATEAIAEYIAAASIESGPLFRPRAAPRSEHLSDAGMIERTMNRLLMRYLEKAARRHAGGRASGWLKGTPVNVIAAFAAGDSGNSPARQRRADRGRAGPPRPQTHHDDPDYDKRRRAVRDSASHKMPI